MVFLTEPHFNSKVDLVIHSLIQNQRCSCGINVAERWIIQTHSLISLTRHSCPSRIPSPQLFDVQCPGTRDLRTTSGVRHSL